MTVTAADDSRPLWDIVVVGSGPAGSAAAIAALVNRPTAAVLLLDRSDFPRDKCCGDAVFGAGIRELGAYGVDTDALLAGYRPVRDLRLVSDGGVTVRGRLPESMTVIPRTVLDSRLRDAALRLGAEARRHAVRQLVASHDYVELDNSIRARVVIGADGSESVVRRALGSHAGRDVAIALRGYERNARGDGEPLMVFDHRRGLAYAWRFPSSRGGANVGYGHLLHPNERAGREDLLATMRRLLPDLDSDVHGLRAHRLPLSTTRQRLGRGRVMLAGDAAALINPLSGEGIFYAIVSGLAAGTAAVAGDARVGERYADLMRRRFARHHRDTSVLARLTRMRPVLEAGMRAAGRNPYVFDDLVGLGLAQGTVTPRFTRELCRELLQTCVTGLRG